MHRRRLPTSQNGFTLIEVMVAATVLLGGLAGTLTMITGADRITGATRAREGATALQRELVEAIHEVPFDQLAQTGLVARLQSEGAIGDSSLGASGWTVRRRGVTYTVAIGACAVDDARDGSGPHDAGMFCASGANTSTADQCSALIGPDGTPADGVTATATAGDCGIDLTSDGAVDGLVAASAQACSSNCTDSNPVDYARIVALIRWEGDTGKRWSLQGATIANPGLSVAPAVSALTAGGATTITSSATTSFSATATVAPAPAAFAWYVDGTAQGTTTGSSTSWNFTWPLGNVSGGASPNADEVLDGSYLVGARAYDRYGQAGVVRTLTVVLNRRAPYPPANLEAGVNGDGVELEWSPGREHDIVGYRAVRFNGLSWTEVCTLALQTSCRDTDPPLIPALYAVIAVDRDAAGTLRDGAQSTAVLATAAAAPGTPGSLQASAVSGDVVLTWTASSGEVDHYEIYRDGQAVSDRYDRTDATELTYTDKHTNGVLHDYSVAAVSAGLARSPLVGPVTR